MANVCRMQNDAVSIGKGKAILIVIVLNLVLTNLLV